MTARERRVLTWGGAVIIGAVLMLRVIPQSVSAVATLRESTHEHITLHARAMEVLESRESVRDSLRRVLGDIVALAPKLIDGVSQPEAQASLSSLMSLAAGRQGVRVLRVDPLPDSAVGVFNRVSIHAELETDIRGLTRLLRALEIGRPLLTVTLRAVTASETGTGPNQPEVLRIEMQVAGYYVPRGARS